MITINIWFISGEAVSWELYVTKTQFLSSINLEKRFIVIDECLLNTDNIEYIEVKGNE